MAEIRKEATKGTWTIVAPARGNRPFDFSGRESSHEEEVDDDCPFCPGNESETPEEVYAVRDEGAEETDWKVRVFPNKFPALEAEGGSGIIEGGLFESRGGYGHHEVAVETPRHDEELVDLPAEGFETLIRTYRERLEDLIGRPDISYVSIFKNRGERAGASLEHPHSQIMATTFVPSTPRREYELAGEYRRDRGSCLYCDLVEREAELGERTVLEDDHFFAVCPFGSRFPYETWILPKRHSATFGGIRGEEAYRLGLTLKRVLTALTEVLGAFPYNYTIHTGTPADPGSEGISRESYHWHLEIMPRLTTPAGFERGTSDYINIVSPEEAARSLREEASEL